MKLKRDMELVRKILFIIEEKYIDVTLLNSDIQIKGYDMEAIGYHCSILNDAGLISSYKGYYASNKLYSFGVGRLTWEGHELLDKIRSDTVWKRTKDAIIKKGIPFVLDAIKEIATAITAEMIKKAILGT